MYPGKVSKTSRLSLLLQRLRRGRWAHRALAGGVALLFGVIGYAVLQFSSAAPVPEYVVSRNAQTNSDVGGATFRVEVQYSGGNWDNLGTRTTAVSLNTGGVSYRLTIVSVPAGYTFNSWLLPNNIKATSSSVTFGADVFNGQTIAILMNPSGPPVPPPSLPSALTLRANGSTGTVSVSQNSSLTLSWTATGASSCLARGSWSGSKPVNGSENRTGDTASIGTRSYELLCYGSGGSGIGTVVTVNVTAPQSQPPPSNPTPSSPSPATPAPSSPAPTPKPRVFVTTPQTPPTVTVEPDQTPPSAPGDVRIVREPGGVLTVSWIASEDSSGINGYKIERQEGEEGDFVTLIELHPLTSFSDETTQGNGTYRYRISAIDNAGNVSEASQSDVSAPAVFEANVYPESDAQITNGELNITVILPAGSTDEPIMCELVERTSFLLLTNKQRLLAGPFELLCRTSDDMRVLSFKNSLTAHIQVSKAKMRGIGTLSLQKEKTDGWEIIVAESKYDSKLEQVSFTYDGTGVVAVGGSLKKTSVVGTVLLVLLVVTVVGTGIFVGVKKLNYHLAMKRYLDEQDEIFRRSQGLQ